MNAEDVIAEFRAAGALREGRLVLSSGRRSSTFLQNKLTVSRLDRAERLYRAPADKIRAAMPIEGLGSRRLSA
ncbi:MAG TPA: hypothetical protein VG960_04265 [Caulobacteraceae bacterium]|nr:hypothetical protein [Caulobacteraceae bacterium]